MLTFQDIEGHTCFICGCPVEDWNDDFCENCEIEFVNKQLDEVKQERECYVREEIQSYTKG